MNIRRILEAKGTSEVYTLEETATLAEFVQRACEKDIGAMLVTHRDGTIAGILTERDILRQCHAGADFRATRVGDVMTRRVATVQADDDIKTAMDYMVTLKIRHLPVLEGDRLAGLITVRDLLLAMRKADDRETQLLVDYLRQSLRERGVTEERYASA